MPPNPQPKNNSFIRISPQCAFPNGPWDTNPTFTDLTQYLRADSDFQITRGRSNEFSQFEAGKLTGLILDNRTRVFDPQYSSAPAPFAGNVYPSKQFQIVAEYPWLPGMLPEGNLRNTGWVAYSGGSSPTTYDQAGFTYDQGSYDAGAANVTLSLASGDAPLGLTPQQALAMQVISGTHGAARWTFAQAAVKGSSFVTLSVRVKMTSANAGATPQTQTIGFNFYDGFGNVINPVSGSYITTITTPKRVWGDGVWDMGFITVFVPASAATVELELQSEVFQANDTVYWDAIVFDYCSKYINKTISYTYVDDWKLTYKGRDALCTVSTSDAFAAFGVKDLTSLTYEATVAALPNLRHYWTFGERADYNLPYTQEYAPGTARLLTKGPFIGWGVPGPVLTDLTTAVGLTQDANDLISGWFDAQKLLNPPGATGTGYSIGFWCQQNTTTDRIIDLGQGQDFNDWANGNPSDVQGFQIYTNDNQTPATAIQMISQAYVGTTYQNLTVFFSPPPDVVDPRIPAYTTPGNFYDGAWHFVVITMATDNKTFNFYVDGQQVTPRTPSVNPALWGSVSGQSGIATGVLNFPQGTTGLVGGSQSNPNGGYTGQLAHLMVVDRVMTASEISNLYNIAQNQWFGQSPQSRVNAVLDTVTFPSTKRNLDVGSSTLAAETGNLSQTNALQYLQYVQDSESGWIFCDMGGNVRFIGRLAMVKVGGATAQWTLGDLWPTNAAVELPLVDTPDIDNSNTLIYTEAEGSLGSGASGAGTGAGTSGGTLYYYADNTTMVNQGKRSISKTNMLNTTEAELYATLQYLVTNYKTPRQRLQKIKIMPLTCDELMQFVLSVEIGQVIQVNLRPPPGGSNVTSLLGRVQHIQHTGSRKTWMTEIDVATVDVNTYLNLDDPTLGKLDSGNKLFF